MRTAFPFLSLCLLLAAPLPAATVQVIELYQSQGCSSCPPANAALNGIADRTDIIALSFAVTYWDQLGWTDRFAKPAFTARQRAYAASMGAESVYTPQMVLNGRKAIVGSRKGELEAALKSAPTLPGVAFRLENGSVHTAAGGPPRDIWLVSYDPRIQQVAVKAGENSGRTLPHRNIVTGLQLIGKSGSRPLKLPPAIPGQSRILLLQEPDAGPIIDAVRL